MFLLQQEMSTAAMALVAFRASGVVAVGGAAASLCLGRLLLKATRAGSYEQGLRVNYLGNSLVIMPLDRWSTITKKGLSLAVQLKGQIRIVHVDNDGKRAEFESQWERNVAAPLRSADRIIPELVMLSSRSGHVLQPIAEYILETERLEPDRQIIVVVPQLAVRHWWQKPLHNHRSRLLKLILTAFGGQRIMIIDVPWYL